MSQRITTAKLALREYPREYLTRDQYTSVHNDAINTVDAINSAINKLSELENNIFTHIDDIILNRIKEISDTINKNLYDDLYNKLLNDLTEKLYTKLYTDIFNNLYEKIISESNKTIINTVKTNIDEINKNIMSKRISKSYQNVKSLENTKIKRDINLITKEIISNLKPIFQQNETNNSTINNVISQNFTDENTNFEKEYENFINNLKNNQINTNTDNSYVEDFKSEYNDFITNLKHENAINNSINSLIDTIESEILEILEDKLTKYSLKETI